MTEAQLLNAYATHRDAEAFAQIVRRYQQLIFATCRRTLHHPDDTDDAVQETFLKLAQKAGDLRTNLGGWLHACAVHVCIDTNRRREVRARHESSGQPAPAATEPQMQLAELGEHLDQALPWSNGPAYPMKLPISMRRFRRRCGKDSPSM